MKKILITGGAGFIGAEIVSQLFNTGEWDITVLDIMNPQIHGSNWKDSFLYKKIENKCKFIFGSVCNQEIVEKAIGDNEYIIHLAAETGTGQSMYMINQYNETNVMGISNLLQVISSLKSKSKVRKIILSSSRSVYGEGRYICDKCGVVYPGARKKDRMINKDFGMYCDKCGRKLRPDKTPEDSEIRPNSLYAFTKYTQEMMLETMCPALEIEYTIFRFQNVYGVGQSLMNPYTGILSIFSSLLMDNKPINIFEDGLESRDFINVVDVAHGVISSLECVESNGEIINLGSGKGTSVIEIAQILKKAYCSDSEINITGDFRLGDIAYNVASIEKAEKILAFKQTITLEEGLSKFCCWVKNQEHDDSLYNHSLNEMEDAGMFIRG